MIQYTITPVNLNAHLFSVSLSIPVTHSQELLLSLPAWIPGSYMIRDFAKNIISMTATCDGESVRLIQKDKQTWQVKACKGVLCIEYEVYAWDLSVRSAHLDNTHGFFNGTSTFLRVHGQESAPCELLIQPPVDGSEWSVYTGMPAKQIDDNGFGLYGADNYEALIDYPVEMGAPQVVEFTVQNVPHKMVFTGVFEADLRRVAKDVQAICETEVVFWGELPMTEYVFMTMVTENDYGGLEHRNSTALMCSRNDLPYEGMSDPSENYQRFLSLCAHEYFHSWHVKRLRPAVYMNLPLDSEVYTELLWVFEGFTSYYDDLMLVRAGLITAQDYLKNLSKTLTRVFRSQGRFKQTLAESSFNTWTKFYKQDENAVNAIVSYYTKGAWVALVLDMKIREATVGERSLDDVMRRLWCDFGSQDIGLQVGDVERIATEVAGVDLSGFFAQALYSTKDIALDDPMNFVGVKVKPYVSASQADLGGAVPKSPRQSLIGLRVKTVANGLEVLSVVEHSPASRAGISAGDVLIALNQLQITNDKLEQLELRGQVGESIVFHAFRRDELYQTTLLLETAVPDSLALLLEDAMNDETTHQCAAWLGVKTECLFN